MGTKSNISLLGFRRRMMLAVNDTKPDYTILDAHGVAIMDIKGKFYPDVASWQAAGSPTANGIAVSDGVHRFCISKDMIAKVNDAGDYPDTEYWGAWGTQVNEVKTTDDKTLAKQDFDGFSNTDAIVYYVNYSDGYFTKYPLSAAGLCNDYIFPNGKRGYLGALGEWHLVQNSIDTINTLMDAIGERIDTNPSSWPYYWSSTQFDSDTAWYWSFYSKNFSSSSKYYKRRVRAFCTLDNP